MIPPAAEHERSEGALVGCRETTRKGLVRGRARTAVEKVREKSGNRAQKGRSGKESCRAKGP